MKTNCRKCKVIFDKYQDEYCKDCYELQILKGQCLNGAIIALRGETNPQHEDYPQKVYDLAKRLFCKGTEKEVNFKNW